MSSPPRDSKELLIEYLRVTQDTCPGCEFSLNGLKEPRCPECGLELRLQVGHGRQIGGPILVAIIPSGFAMIATPFYALPVLDEWIKGNIGVFFTIWSLLLLGFGVLSTFFGLGLIWQRRRFVCLPETKQMEIAVVTWLVHFTVFVWVLVTR